MNCLQTTKETLPKLDQLSVVADALLLISLAILYLGEHFPANGWQALAIILAGVALAWRRPKYAIISINKRV